MFKFFCRNYCNISKFFTYFKKIVNIPKIYEHTLNNDNSSMRKDVYLLKKKDQIKNETYEKNNKSIEIALKYFSKTEIFYLFFIPFVFVSIYLISLWGLFKYICNIKDVEHFLKVVRWLKGKDAYPIEYMKEETYKRKNNNEIIIATKKFS